MPGRILILDDNDLALRQWRRVGDRMGCDTVTVATAHEAIEAIEAGPIAGMVSDFALTSGTSLPALRIVATVAPAVPTIVVTSDPSRARSALRAEGLAYPVFAKRLSMVTVLHAMASIRETGAPEPADTVASVEVGGRTYIAELFAASSDVEVREEPGGALLSGVLEGGRFSFTWASLHLLKAADQDAELVRLGIDLALNDR